MALRANAGRLLVHQIGAQVARETAELARTLRGPAALARGEQLVRAACSVTANIAAACARGTVDEFRQCLVIARGSAHELRSQIHIARLLSPGDGERCMALESRVTLVIKMLGRLHDHPPTES